jgi:hypothetical protein
MAFYEGRIRIISVAMWTNCRCHWIVLAFWWTGSSRKWREITDWTTIFIFSVT